MYDQQIQDLEEEMRNENEKLPTLEQAEVKAKVGMLAAAGNADKCNPDWTSRACEKLVDYASLCGRDDFLIEDVRAYASENGMPKAPDARAWGFAARAMAKAGLIEPVGFARARSSNGSPKTLWRAAQ